MEEFAERERSTRRVAWTFRSPWREPDPEPAPRMMTMQSQTPAFRLALHEVSQGWVAGEVTFGNETLSGPLTVWRHDSGIPNGWETLPGKWFPVLWDAKRGTGESRPFGFDPGEEADVDHPLFLRATLGVVDSDQDGMDDGWELWHFGVLVSPHVDADGDGLSNLEEYLTEAGLCRIVHNASGATTIADPFLFGRLISEGEITVSTSGELAWGFVNDSSMDALTLWTTEETDDPQIHPRLRGLRSNYQFALVQRDEQKVKIEITGGQFKTLLEFNPGTGNHMVSQTPVDGVSPSRDWSVDLTVGPSDRQVLFTEQIGAQTRALRVKRMTGPVRHEYESGSDGTFPEKVTIETLATDSREITIARDGIPVSSHEIDFVTRERFGSLPLITRWETQNGTETRTWTRSYHENGALLSETWNGPGAYSFTGNADGQPVSLTRGPFTTAWDWQDGKWTETTSRGSTELSRHQPAFPTLLNWEDTATLGTETVPLGSATLWAPAEVAPGHLPWTPKTVSRPDGTFTRLKETWTSSGREVEIFEGLADQSEGVRHNQTFDAFGPPLNLESTIVPGNLTLREESFVNSPFGPTSHTATDGFGSSFTRDGGGRITTMTTRHVKITYDIQYDELNRPKTFTDTLRNVQNTFDSNGLTHTHTASGGGNSHVTTATLNGFGETASSGFAGPQPHSGSSKWENGVFTSDGTNAHTHAEGKSSFDEQTLESVVRANTAAGLVWQNHDTHFDLHGRPNRHTRPGQPDILIAYDALGRVHRRALNFNGNGAMNPGTDLILETTREVFTDTENGNTQSWRVSHYLVHGSGTNEKHLLSQTQANAAERFFSSRIGGRAPDEITWATPDSGEFTLSLNQ